jgi:hypothetical protein
MKISGKVVQRPVAVGSKSQRDAVMLDTASASYVLRRQGGNPFHDPQLVELVGKQIECTGTLHGDTLIMSSWTELSG